MSVEKQSGGGRLAVGREVRHWRQQRGLTLAQVRDRSGLNVGYLSQIENDKALPSLEALAQIAAALDVPAAWLLLDSSTPPRVVRAVERPRTGVAGGAEMTEVDAGTSRDVCILEVTTPPGHGTGIHAHQGDEHHVVVAGRWRFTQGDHVLHLGPGDYLAWDPTIPHDVENVGDEEGRMLVIYPRRGRRDAVAATPADLAPADASSAAGSPAGSSSGVPSPAASPERRGDRSRARRRVPRTRASSSS